MSISHFHRPDSNEARIEALEQALKHAREVGDAERRARLLAEDSMRQAWRLSVWTRPAGLEAK